MKVLVICEKPSASGKIAAALAQKRPAKKDLNGVPYYQFERDGKTFVVVPAIGHLYTLKNTRPMRDYPIYDVEWVPLHKADRKAEHVAVFIEAIKKLAEDAEEFISACDFDIEGSVVAYNVLRFICGEESIARARRMKFSTLTAQDLERAYENLMPHLDFEVIEAGLTRHILDWYWGMNLSKALTAAVQTAESRFVKLSAGRVQTPTLKILSERERDIQKFEPEPFWEVHVTLEIDGIEIEAEHEQKRFTDKIEAERVFDACNEKDAKVLAIESRKYRRLPPVPFDLGTLQSEAYRCFGYTPMKTQRLAQDLYQAALISYPRTSSQKLPPSIGYAEIIQKLGQISSDFRKIASQLLTSPKLVPAEGKKTDPAHPAIFPTGESPEKLSGPHKRLYDLIVRRFFSVFGKPALVESMKVKLDIGGESFSIHGRRILDGGWLRYYGRYATTEEIVLPELEKGQELKAVRWELEEKETQPPPRYNPASIVKEMEAKHLGTKGTRGPTIQTLYDRGYIFGTQITVSDLGMQVIEALNRHCPEIVSEELTAKFELEMEAIQEGKRRKEEVLKEARDELDRILQKFKLHEAEIGKKLGEAQRAAVNKARLLGKCPACGGDLKVIVSRKSRKRFAGCSNYPKCNFSFPLPQRGFIMSLNQNCPQCGAPMIQVKLAGRRPYRMCLDPKCPTKEKWKSKRP